MTQPGPPTPRVEGTSGSFEGLQSLAIPQRARRMPSGSNRPLQARLSAETTHNISKALHVLFARGFSIYLRLGLSRRTENKKAKRDEEQASKSIKLIDRLARL